MKNITLSLIAITTLLSCSQASNEQFNPKNLEIKPISSGDVSDKNQNPYNISFSIEKNELNEHYLVINMELFDEAYFLAPSSDKMFLGRFDISLEKNESIQLQSNYIETPSATKESDPFGNGPIMVQRVNSIYKKKIIINTDKDFEITGLVLFTIEPKCTLEKIEYTITSKSGKIEVIKK